MTMGAESETKAVGRKNFADMVTEAPLTADEERALDGRDAVYGTDDEAPAVNTSETPEWAAVPPDLKMPIGRQIYFLRFRARWTDRPDKGERQCLLWNLTEADEKLALRRTRGDAFRAVDELSKQMVRAIDGQSVNWTSVSPETFWNEIGGSCRQLLKNHYSKTHMLGAEETADFFANCIAVRTAKG